jgi:CO/xanthine dehydrogenase FAD-binding subunit
MYLRPTELSEALRALSSARLAVLAGGTDFYPASVGRPVREDILDITALAGLQGITEDAEALRIGALVTWSELVRHPLPRLFDGLKQAACEVGGLQIQNAGTVAGNICNASPAADGIPALLALDAEVELAALDGVRRLPLCEFVSGARTTLRRPDELVTAILIPRWRRVARSTFRKLGARRYLVISIVMVAATIELDADGTVAHAAVAVGACSAVAQRLPKLEARLVGKPLASTLADLARRDDLVRLTPISDVRGSAEYRQDAALALVRRALALLSSE